MSTTNVSDAKNLIKYHEVLCFIQAYPDDTAILKLANRQLADFSQRVEEHISRHPGDSRLDDTGIIGTPIYYPYNFPMTEWLVRNFGDAVEIDWTEYNKRESDPILGLLPLFALYVENDGIDDEDLATSSWIKAAVGNTNSLKWLLYNLEKLNIGNYLRQYLYDNAEFILRWQLDEKGGSRTLAALPDKKIYFQKSAIKKERVVLSKSIRKRPPDMKLIAPTKGRLVIETLTRALLPRHRELYPLTYANSNEVYQIIAGRGLEIYFLGMKPENRMPLETNYSALIIKNGVPIGYGISVVFFKRCEIALNIFDAFRSGEASYIFEYFIRTFYHHFGSRDFLMRKYQVGHENDEGIKSGSYWFYYKMGFRSIAPETARLAEEEWRKIQNDSGYRTSHKTLRQLAKSDLYWTSGPAKSEPYRELSVINLGYAVTNMIASDFNGDRPSAKHWAVRRLEKILRPGLRSGWSDQEKMHFERLAPLLILIPDLENWDKNSQTALIRVIKLKAAEQEIGYANELCRFSRLNDAFDSIADQPAKGNDINRYLSI